MDDGSLTTKEAEAVSWMADSSRIEAEQANSDNEGDGLQSLLKGGQRKGSTCLVDIKGEKRTGRGKWRAEGGVAGGQRTGTEGRNRGWGSGGAREGAEGGQKDRQSLGKVGQAEGCTAPGQNGG